MCDWSRPAWKRRTGPKSEYSSTAIAQNEALAQPPDARARFVSDQIPDDVALRDEVLSLNVIMSGFSEAARILLTINEPRAIAQLEETLAGEGQKGVVLPALCVMSADLPAQIKPAATAALLSVNAAEVDGG